MGLSAANLGFNFRGSRMSGEAMSINGMVGLGDIFSLPMGFGVQVQKPIHSELCAA